MCAFASQSSNAARPQIDWPQISVVSTGAKSMDPGESRLSSDAHHLCDLG